MINVTSGVSRGCFSALLAFIHLQVPLHSLLASHKMRSNFFCVAMHVTSVAMHKADIKGEGG
jgi:hypothetical protein